MSGVSDVLLLRRLTARDRRAVLLGLCVLLPALLYVGAIRPYRGMLQELRDRTSVEGALLQREQALLADAGVIGGSAGMLHVRADDASRRLVHAANVPLAEAELTALLETLASLSRVLLQEMRGVQPPRAGTDGTSAVLQPLRLALRGESDLEGVLTFVQRIESGPLLLRIVELSMEPAGEDRAGVVQFGLVVEAFAPAEEASP
ncbi:MAG: hypothetical protein WEF86_08690 [Gemmatimonadota bacterium]